jgi:hypothetical protein
MGNTEEKLMPEILPYSMLSRDWYKNQTKTTNQCPSETPTLERVTINEFIAVLV